MRKYIFILISLFCFANMGYAQQTGVLKRKVEINTNIKSNSMYNRFLVKAIKETDELYSGYEELVQKVWNKEAKEDLTEESKKVQELINEYKELVKSTRVYKGGDAYMKATSSYIEATIERIKCLEKYGVLGADDSSDVEEYNNSKIAFDKATDNAISKRNIVQVKKKEFENIESKKSKKQKQ